jgi:hypothetical protein
MAAQAKQTPPPAALVRNVAQLMGTDETNGAYWLEMARRDILRSYKLLGNRYFFSDVDAQALAWLLDRKHKQTDAVEFRRHWGENAIDDLAECQTWKNAMAPDQQRAVQNLRYFLAYALQPYKKLEQWEAHADVFIASLDSKQALSFLVTPLLKSAVAFCEHVAELSSRLDETSPTDAERIVARGVLFEPATKATDCVVLNVLFDSLFDAPEKTRNTPATALRDRLDLMRHYVKERALKRK